MAKKKFVRRDSHRFSKLGKNRKKLQKWRKPKGRDNKMRERRFGYPASPSVGYKKQKKESGKIGGMETCLVYNLKDLDIANKFSIIIVGKVGAKKKIEILKRISEKKLNVLNASNGAEKWNLTRKKR